MKKVLFVIITLLLIAPQEGSSHQKKKPAGKKQTPVKKESHLLHPPSFNLHPSDTVQLPLKFNLKEMGFGAQGVGIIACQYLTIQNTTLENMQIADIYSTLPKEFTIPSPSRAMYPVNIQPKRSLTVSICFTPDFVTSFRGNLIVKTMKDSTVIPIWGKGISPSEIGKQPMTGITTTALKKGKQASINMTLRNQCRVVLQVMDELGNVARSYFGNELMNPGNYEEIFDGTEKGGKKLPPGNFYARFIATEVNNSREIKMTKMFTIK